MPKTILKNIEIEVDGTDLSNRASSVEINTNADDVDLTAFKSDFKEHGVGLRDATFTVGFFQDLSTGSVDDTLWPLALSGEAFPIKVTDLDSPGSEPYQMEAVLLDYSPLAGSVGEASKTDVTFPNAAQQGVTRPAS